MLSMYSASLICLQLICACNHTVALGRCYIYAGRKAFLLTQKREHTAIQGLSYGGEQSLLQEISLFFKQEDLSYPTQT